jgi:glycosyltransferase involved in cell wall biosynthesis
MDIVIVSANFFPAKDAESFCATRFASALARRGHRVHVIAFEPVSSVSDVVYKALVDDRVTITRIPFARRRRSVFSQIRYRCPDWETAVLPKMIAATKAALAEMKDPILMSRTYPISSLVVGYCCRKAAKKWICHLSDPIPHATWTPRFSLRPGRLMDYLKWRWMRGWIAKGFRCADAVSVTCPGVLRFYRERYPGAYGDKPKFVTTHIGDTRLAFLGAKPFERTFSGKMVLHPGELYSGRKMDALANAILKLNRNGVSCALVHVGKGNDIDSQLKNEFPKAYLRYPDDPALAIAASKETDVLYVTDSITGLPYSPQILSKFVYQLFEDKPILVETSSDGMMRACCDEYPEAGLFWVDRDRLETVEEALARALACSPAEIDRTRIRAAFSETEIARTFEKNVAALVSEGVFPA